MRATTLLLAAALTFSSTAAFAQSSPITQFILGGAIYLLYEISIVAVAILQRPKPDIDTESASKT